MYLFDILIEKLFKTKLFIALEAEFPLMFPDGQLNWGKGRSLNCWLQLLII